MTLHPAAFRVGEYARLACEKTIRMLQAKHAENDILYCVPDMDQHAGKLVLIVQNAWPIPGVAYRLEEVMLEAKQRVSILGIWTEEAIVDHCISTDTMYEPFGQLASEVYTATANNEEGAGMVSIYDREKRLFCSFRDAYASDTARAVNRIAQRRCRSAFEQYFGFDGEYPR